MSLLKKVGKGLKKATKAVGKGAKNAAKFTAKNPLKVLAPIAGVAATIATAGAVAPALTAKLAASKIGGTVLGKMVTKTMKTGTIVREKIGNTLKKNGKKGTKEEIDLIENHVQNEVKKRKGHKLPVDKTSKSGTEAREKLKRISAEISEKVSPSVASTIAAERGILKESALSGIFSKSEVSDDVNEKMREAGEIKQNVLGSAVSAVGGFLGLDETKTAKAQSVLNMITGNDEDPFYSEDFEDGLEFIEARQNARKGSFIDTDKITEWIKKPVVWVVLVIAGVAYYFMSNNKKSKK